MPIYEYKCEHCGDTFEVLQKFNENPLTECILCHEGPVKKLISVSSFVLKGSGFYVNDYAKKAAPKEKSSSSSSASSENSKVSSTSDTKKETTASA
ncbi:putative regulatory protein, FmdB family [Candidatus Vecturithrix granuli]|uniref:Putative regulatory protein, FmdB family n=1 Tax=Vecturithrix granuli TaxID=1499967 RepID=A0A081C6K2_VECG1|nr:putative regulatory protein, FmdB family [Candidatus Vecturithrix granuli]